MANTLSGKSERGKPKLLDQMRRILRLKHYSLRTETAYCEWVKRFILFHGKRHPRDPGPAGCTFEKCWLNDARRAAIFKNRASPIAVLRGFKKIAAKRRPARQDFPNVREYQCSPERILKNRGRKIIREGCFGCFGGKRGGFWAVFSQE